MANINEVVNQTQIASLAASLRAVEQKILKQNHQAGITRIWYQGEESYFDVFFELQNEEIIWFQFTLRGKSLSWDSKKPGWQTGVTNEFKFDDVSFYAASKTIENDNQLDWEFINLVKSILQERQKELLFIKALELFN